MPARCSAGVAAEMTADAMGALGASRSMSLFADVAFMRCLGYTTGQIVRYYAVLLAVSVVVGLVVAATTNPAVAVLAALVVFSLLKFVGHVVFEARAAGGRFALLDVLFTMIS